MAMMDSFLKIYSIYYFKSTKTAIGKKN